MSMVAGGVLEAKAAIPFPDIFARDAMIAWFRGEFAAANAIIDALLSHLSEISCRESVTEEYETVFASIHRRRMNWIPVLHMQKYFSIADVSAALRRAAEARISAEIEQARSENCSDDFVNDVKEREEGLNLGDGDLTAVDGENEDEDPAVNDGGSSPESTQSRELIRPERIRTVKGFVAKEPVKGNMVNVVKGLKLYEDVLSSSETLKLTEFVNELRLSGRRGELSGSTFIYFNQQSKGNKREIIQLGTPIFQPAKDDVSSQLEAIPEVLQSVIDRLIQWGLIPEAKRPNSCIINFFDEDEHSQPYFKPPHLDIPVSTLVLSETTIAFGRFLAGDNHGGYKGSLSLSLKDGSLLVMRGNSADLARHVINSSPNRRISITFVKVRPTNEPTSLSSPTCTAPEMAPVSAPVSPTVMLAAAGRRVGRAGTGVFLPWTGGGRKYHKHVPPRIQRRRMAALMPAPVEAAG